MSHIFFPDYLWKRIFDKFDNPIKILNLREVSSELEVLVEEYFEAYKLWEKLCEDEIKLWAYQIMDKVRPKKLTNTTKRISSQADWKEIFLHYCKWRSQSSFTSLALEVDYTLKFSTDEQITCTTVWRDIVIAGTNQGKIFLSDIEDDPTDIAIGFDNKTYIKELKVWRVDETIAVIAVLSRNKRLKFFNLTTQDEDSIAIEKPGKGLLRFSNPNRRHLCPTSLKYYATNICVGLDHRFFAENNFRVTEYKFIENKIHCRRTCDLSLATSSSTSSKKFLSMHSENNLLMVMIEADDVIQVLEVNFSKVMATDPKLTNVEVIKIIDISKYSTVMISIIPIKELGLIFFGNNILSYRSTLSNSKEWNDFELTSFENEIITCAAMHANLLLLGWNTGHFSKIYLDSIEEFSHFNNPPNEKNDTFKLVDVPIVGINVTEFRGISYIVVSTQTTQYFIANEDKLYDIGARKLGDSDQDSLSDIDDDYIVPTKRRKSL
ncbi:uncharacterized protein LOC130663683 [Microplitis mediator]|uniref:uncharacterized protein LOC130663683 n=1 Tax=Microplitis mediator TaxID=375433 RepID=UPI002557143C|nr:uncharacterized protein LOC130663683 [Microplitis mediator]